MKIHFIWFGSVPHPDLITKVARKMKYLRMMFADIPELTFYLWTTNNLKVSLTRGFISQEDLTGGWHLDIQIKDINELFNRTSLYLSFDDTCSLKDLFIKESFGSLNKMALAADMLKMLILLHFGGLFMDAGLEIDYKAISDELKTRGQNLLKKLAMHHLAFSYTIAPNRAKNPFDLQIMYSRNTHGAKKFLGETIAKILGRSKADSDYQTIRKKRFGGHVMFKFRFKNKIYEVPKPGEIDAYTGVEFIAAAMNLDQTDDGMIYRFLIKYKKNDLKVFPTAFEDFPGIYRKLANPNYANWRDNYYTPGNAQYDTFDSANPYAVPPEIYKLSTDFFNNYKNQVKETHSSPEKIFNLVLYKYKIYGDLNYWKP